MTIVCLRLFMAHLSSSRSPVPEGEPWPIYSRNQPRYYIFDGLVKGLGNGPRATGCAFWNELMPSLTDTLRKPEPGQSRCSPGE